MSIGYTSQTFLNPFMVGGDYPRGFSYLQPYSENYDHNMSTHLQCIYGLGCRTPVGKFCSKKTREKVNFDDSLNYHCEKL